MGGAEFLRPRGFEDRRVDQPDNRRTPDELLRAQPPLRSNERAALWRIVSNAPQAVVILLPGLRTASQLQAHLNYVTRGGSLALRDEAGLALNGRDDLRELVDDWKVVERLDSRRRSDAPLARRLVLSGPAGASPVAVEAAAALHLSRTHASHPHVRVAHNDTAHPHVHVVIRSLGRNRSRLTPHSRDLVLYREGFAQALRDVGIEADASPRWLRGQAGRGPSVGQWRTGARFEIEGGPPPGWVKTQLVEAAQIAFSERPPPPDRELRVLTNQGRLRRSYLDLAARLAKSPELEDRSLGGAIEGFVRNLPSPETERLRLGRRMRPLQREPSQGAESALPRAPSRERGR